MKNADLLQRAANSIRLPTSPDRKPELLESELAFRCPVTGDLFPYRNGILELLPRGRSRTVSQKALDTRLTAWIYDRVRDSMLKFAGMPSFQSEVQKIQDKLQVGPGSTVLDLACGHGNFTTEWAQRTGPGGLVIGLDLSLAMLKRAAERIKRSGLNHVLLIHADAQELPVATQSMTKVNCSGGFHSIPDLERTLGEIARISPAGATLTASMFAENPQRPHPRFHRWLKNRYGFHFVSPLWLGEKLCGLGYSDYTWTIPKRWFAYASAVKTVGNPPIEA